VLERLADQFSVTLFFHNPNILPEAEYQRRLEAQRIAADHFAPQGVRLRVPPYEPNVFLAVTAGLEAEAEGGARCTQCFALRLEATAQAAKDGGFDLFTSTLSVSPHKNAARLNEIGIATEVKYGIPYLPADFKKQDGYRRSITLATELGLYRQKYCGCVFV